MSTLSCQAGSRRAPDFPREVIGVEGSRGVSRLFGVRVPQSVTSRPCNNNPYYVYMLASIKGVLYIGMTRDIATRMEQHRPGSVTGFSSAHRTTKLVWCEAAESFEAAREREAQLRRWRRSKKAALIEINNPYWEDISTQVA